MNPLLIIALLLVMVALLLAGGGLLYHGRRNQQASSALQSALDATHHTTPDNTPKGSWWQRRLADLSAIGQQFDGSRVQKALLAPEDKLLLEQVGWNHSAGTAAFLALRLLLAMVLPLLGLLLLRPQGGKFFLVLMVGFALGVLLPKLVLRSWAGRLRKKVDDELPLLIDLLRLLQGVGFSIDQSLQMIGDKLHVAVPVLGRELQVANANYSRGRSRAQSLRRLSESFDNDDLRSLVQMVLQVHQHGGAVQEPLKQFGMRLREQRRMKMKEKVGKLSVKMTVVMMLTLLPALMLVLAGPAIISLSNALKGM
ncbi:type II secretion system F family protein [Stenotrophomonas sp. UBA7606]|uniref:type II secretion system F family protein n=1 Tax=Stenotrophomonas sp. UBA7606 TaxID=1947559 RepID=UPI0025EA0A09|nr:type II secretion system F family protein [Stenotrophomonas sp. UBA7606]